MRRLEFVTLLIAILVLLPACSSLKARGSEVPGCGDFLAEFGMRPPELQYVGCRPENLSQLKALKAEYRVRGENAKLVEQKLVETVGLKPLRFVCCGWETQSVSFLRDDTHFEISMSSGETVEKNWKAIEAFHVVVYKLLEMP